MRSTGIRLTRNRNRMQILSQIGSYFPNLAGLLILTCLMVLSPPKLLTAASSPTGVISLNFVGVGTPMAASETAGVVARSNWNQAIGATSGSTPLSLVDENGLPTGASASWIADDVSATSAPEAPGNARMMKGYLDNASGNPGTVMVRGLAAGKYTIYVYTDSGIVDFVPSTNTFQIGGPGIKEQSIAIDGAEEPFFTGTFIEANPSSGNYVLFKEITVFSGFTLTATPSSTSGLTISTPVNGIQIVPSGSAPDFSMSVLPMSETVTSGDTAFYLVHVASLSGFTGIVNLSLPAGTTGSVFPTSVRGSGSAIVTIHTEALSFTSSGAVPLLGSSGALSHAVELSLTELATPDFALLTSSFDQSVTAGGLATYPLQIVGMNNFTGKVDLSVSGLPAGATASFSTPSLYSSGTTTLTIRTTAATPVGNYFPTVTATSGLLTNTEGLSLEVGSAPDFSISAAPASQRLTGATAKYVIGVSALSGFTGTVSLAVSGLPANATASFSPPSVTGSTISILTVTAVEANTFGGSTLTITGTSGALSHVITVVLVAGTTPDFLISATQIPSPPFNAAYVVSIAALNGFSGTVSLSVGGLLPGMTASFSPASVTAFPGASVVTVFAGTPNQEANDSGTLTITGTSGALSRSATVPFFVVTAPDFGISSPADSQLVTAGSSAVYPITISSFDIIGHFSSPIALTVSGLPAGTTASFDNPFANGSILFDDIFSTLILTTTGSTPIGTSTFTLTGVSGTLSHSITLTMTVSQPGSQPVLSVDFVGSGTAMGASETAGIVNRANWNDAIGAASATPLNLTDQKGSPTGATLSWTSDNVWSLPIADTPGNYRMMRGYLDTGGGHPTTITASGIPPGTYDIYVYTDGDNGSVSRNATYHLSPVQLNPPGMDPPSVGATDPPNTNFSGTFMRAADSNGNYVLFSGVPIEPTDFQPAGFTLTASPDALSRAPVNGIQIALSSGPSPDFSVSSAQSSQTVVPGGATTYTVNIAPLNGFSGPVSLSAVGDGLDSGLDFPPGVTASFNPAVVASLPGTSVLTVTTTGSTPVGTSFVGVIATSGSLINSASVELVVEPPGGTAVTSIDFVGGGTAMAKSEAAGVLIRENWNDAVGAKRALPLQLVDENGSRSGATITWSADAVQSTAVPDLAGNYRMMRGYLDTGSGNPTTVTVSGLTAGTYSIYVYTDGNNGAATNTATYEISGPGITTVSATAADAANNDFSGTFLQTDNGNGNYIVFSNVAVTSGFTLTAAPLAPGGSAPVNGIQIVH